jgi:hypothetical protein
MNLNFFTDLAQRPIRCEMELVDILGLRETRVSSENLV